LEFLAVGAAEVEFVAGEADRDGIARFPLTGSVALGRGGFVLPGVDDALEVNDYRAANVVRS